MSSPLSVSKVSTDRTLSLQGTLLDGHKLSLQLSKAKGVAASTGSKGTKKGATGGQGLKGTEEGTTKVVVRNVAFEATRKVSRGSHLVHLEVRCGSEFLNKQHP